MAGRWRWGRVPLAALTALLHALPHPALAVDAPPPGSDALSRQSSALVEQDLAVALDRLGREDEALAHARAAVGIDPWLKAPWLALATRTLEAGSPDRAAHYAAMAAAIAPGDEAAHELLERARTEIPRDEAARRASAPDCGPAPASAEHAPGSGTASRRECLERRAGLLAESEGAAAGPLTELARIDFSEGRPESAALLLTMAAGLGGGDPALLARAFELSGNPCGASRAASRPDPTSQPACAALIQRRASVETALRDELAALTPGEKEAASARIDGLLGTGMTPEAAARRWRFERRRGQRPLVDIAGLTARFGEDWYESHDPDAVAALTWRRRPGDAAVVVFTVRPEVAGGADAALGRLLTARRPASFSWSPSSFASTDPVRARTSVLSVDADAGGRAEGIVWLAESPASEGLALVIAAFPGTGGLGAEGLEQARGEIQDAMREAILIPSRWVTVPRLDAGVDFPVPVAGGRSLPGDEQSMPWRTFPAGEFTVAFPPGAVVAPPPSAPERSALRRASAVLWFRARFRDRDGSDVAVGDEARAGSVDLLTAKDEEDARTRALGVPAFVPPLSDPGAVLLRSLDVTRTLGAETGASAVSIARFRPSTPGVEWLVCRLAFGRRLIEIDVPAVTGATSIALHWIPATVRPVHGPPPPPPIDLSGRLGITFVRPPPSERRESFYKEGDLRSREFTMIVARGYTVVLDTVSPDAFPVRLTHAGGEAIVRLEKVPRDAAPGGAPGPDALQARLESSVRSWLAREGFEITGRVVRSDTLKPSRSGAASGVEVTFSARPTPKGDQAAGPAGEVKASGRGVLLWSRDGEGFVFLSLSWDADGALRAQEIDLMSGSLRLIRQKTATGA